MRRRVATRVVHRSPATDFFVWSRRARKSSTYAFNMFSASIAHALWGFEQFAERLIATVASAITGEDIAA